MPTYQYRCTECGADLEVVQRMTDAALTVCPTCQGALRKIFSPVGVLFKGSGFYATDNRGKRNDLPAKTDAAKASPKDGSTGSTAPTAASPSTPASESNAPTPAKASASQSKPATTVAA
ncbi:MAG: zinc ribbon domain-containing protein [Propionibacteriaceae bacterium]|jgi:putative FmdB family regulatory protein|nr:zinc ribbon domain-containing protein [Propionibacteriaceae bacterium]